MTFANKKEADAYDKMLDLADSLGEWLQQAPVTLEEEQREGLSLFLAEHKDVLSQILRGAIPQETVKKTAKSKTDKTVPSLEEDTESGEQAA